MISKRKEINKIIRKIAKAHYMERDSTLRCKEKKQAQPAGLRDSGDGAQSGGTTG